MVRCRALPLLLALTLAAGCGGNKCKKACKHIAECLGVSGDAGGGWSCSLSSECTPLEKCQARCILDAPCEAFTDSSSGAAQALAGCTAACAAGPADAGGEGSPPVDTAPPGETPIVVLDSQPDDGPCMPDCQGKVCGPDGCGGSCGTCTSPQTCVDGQCVGGGNCGNVTYEGCCDGETLKYCESNQLQTVDCTSDPSCGWDSANVFYSCGTDGSAESTGQHPKACP